MQQRKLEMTVSEDAYNQLNTLKKEWGYKTIAELLSDSVGISKFLKDQRAKGKEIILRNPRTGAEGKVEGL